MLRPGLLIRGSGLLVLMLLLLFMVEGEGGSILMMSSSMSILSGFRLLLLPPLILGSLILKLSLVLGGDTGLLSDGVCQELTADTREPVGEGALGLG